MTPAMVQKRRALLGLVLGVLVLTPDSLLVRLYTMPAQGQLMYKNLFLSAMVLLAATCLRSPSGLVRAVRAMGARRFLAQGVLFTMTQYCFTLSITNVAAATTLVLLASSPLFAALFSRVFLKEQLSWATIFAMVGGAVGVLTVFVGSILNDETGPIPGGDEAMGLAFGIGTPICLGAYLTFVRSTSQACPDASELAPICLSGPLCVVVGLSLGAQHVEDPTDILWAFVQGASSGRWPLARLQSRRDTCCPAKWG